MITPQSRSHHCPIQSAHPPRPIRSRIIGPPSGLGLTSNKTEIVVVVIMVHYIRRTSPRQRLHLFTQPSEINNYSHSSKFTTTNETINSSAQSSIDRIRRTCPRQRKPLIPTTKFYQNDNSPWSKNIHHRRDQKIIAKSPQQPIEQAADDNLTRLSLAKSTISSSNTGTTGFTQKRPQSTKSSDLELIKSTSHK